MLKDTLSTEDFDPPSPDGGLDGWKLNALFVLLSKTLMGKRSQSKRALMFQDSDPVTAPWIFEGGFH
jgi:hypothetical protein